MTVRIRDICETITVLTPDASVLTARQIFSGTPDLAIIPVVFDDVALGLVSRTGLLELFLQIEDRESLSRLPISKVMLTEPQLVDAGAPAAYIAKKYTDMGEDILAYGLMATEDGRYIGHVSTAKLLTIVSQENASRAKVMKVGGQRLEAARQDLAQIRREQARFMAFLGHEIRTPLTGILGVADLLGDRKLDTEARDYARTISESGRHLDRLLGDFLDLSRLGADKLEIVPGPFHLDDFAKETRMLWSARSASKGLTLKVTSDSNAADRIEGDATRLRQILFNLIGNAMKFTEEGIVSVHLKTRAQPYHGVMLEMTVTDTGIGIADKDKARLFEAFEQAAPDTVHRYGGTGLGLSIAKGLIEQMKGKITLSDNPDGGTVFKVVCPVRVAGPRLAFENKSRKRKANFKLGKVLLVEDHDVSAMVISEALKAVGWHVDIVNTAEQGQRRALNVDYQAILLDLHLGELSGLDLAGMIRRAIGPNQNVPMLAVTADVSDHRMQQCRAAGFNDFVEKPIRPRRLVATLADTIVAYNKTDAKTVHRFRSRAVS